MTSLRTYTFSLAPGGGCVGVHFLVHSGTAESCLDIHIHLAAFPFFFFSFFNLNLKHFFTMLCWFLKFNNKISHNYTYIPSPYPIPPGH